MKTLIIGLTSLLLSAQTSAAVLTPEGTGSKVEKFTLPASATATVEGVPLKLNPIGAGLRAKKVVFVNVKVYVGQLFVTSPESFKKDDPINSLKAQQATAIQMHFLRDVDAENVQKSFKEALKANGVNTEDSAIKQFLETVAKGGEAKEGKALTVLGAKLGDGTESILYETTSGNVAEIKGPAGFIENIFAIWLGKPADDGVAQLKKALLKN